MRQLCVFLSLMAAFAAPAAGQDVEGSKDHPMVSRFPGYVIADYDQQDFGAFEFTVPGEKTQRVEGRYWRITYAIPDGAKKAGPLQIARNYSNALATRGGVKLLESVDAGGGTMTARLPAAGRNIWLETSISNNGEMYTLTIVEEAGLEQKVELSAGELAKLLNESGSVALHGILFDTAQATIKPESSPALAAIGELLKTDPSLKLEIRGHTDNVGSAAANLKLSQGRAAAVRDYLIRNFRVAADRLSTAGFGDTKPLADNGTEEGRAQNRRVELVKR